MLIDVIFDLSPNDSSNKLKRILKDDKRPFFIDKRMHLNVLYYSSVTEH